MNRPVWAAIGMAGLLLAGTTSAGGAPAKPRFFQARLTGAQEVPPVETAARGLVTFTVHRNGVRMDAKLTARNIRDVVVVHLHQGPRGKNGPALAFIYAPADPGGRENGRIAFQTITRGDLEGPLEGQPLSTLIQEMAAGNVYVNVHTLGFTAGEIRGQVVRVRKPRNARSRL